MHISKQWLNHCCERCRWIVFADFHGYAMRQQRLMAQWLNNKHNSNKCVSKTSYNESDTSILWTSKQLMRLTVVERDAVASSRVMTDKAICTCRQLSAVNTLNNKVSPWWDVTLLARRRVLPPGKLRCICECYRLWRTTMKDEDWRQRPLLVWPPYIMCRRASNNNDTLTTNASAMHSEDTKQKKQATLLVTSWFVQIPRNDNPIGRSRSNNVLYNINHSQFTQTSTQSNSPNNIINEWQQMQAMHSGWLSLCGTKKLLLLIRWRYEWIMKWRLLNLDADQTYTTHNC